MEDVRVTWNDFEYNLKGSFAKLREDQILHDMSIVCDGQIIPAHQVGKYIEEMKQSDLFCS